MVNIVKNTSVFPVATRSLRDDLFSPFEQVFDDFFANFFRGSTFDKVKSTSGYPKMDIFEEDGYWVVQAAIPGVKPEDVEVEIVPQEEVPFLTLRISGKMSEEVQTKDVKYEVRELKKSSFSRTIGLPGWVEGDPEASIKDGLLKLRWIMPPALEQNHVRKIAINKE